MARGDQIPMFETPPPLTLLGAARLALTYAELLNAIDEGENTPDFATDLVRIRKALDAAKEKGS